MAKAAKPEFTKEQVETASDMWQRFTVFTKWGCIAVTILLAAMALFLL
jgi:hypothetical protein